MSVGHLPQTPPVPPTVGQANQLYGINSAGDDDEFKTIVAGSNISVVHATGQITFAATGAGTSPVAPSYAYASLPAAGSAGALARVTDSERGLWMDTGSVWRQLAGGTYNILDFGTTGDAIQTAHDALPSTGGLIIVPAGSYTLSQTLSVTKPCVGIILAGDVTIAMGSYPIVVSSGADNFLIRGMVPWGGRGSNYGARLNYTGSGSAISIGDSSAYTYYARLADFWLDLGDSATKGVAVEALVFGNIDRLRIAPASTASDAALFYSDGSTSKVSSHILINQCQLRNGLYGIHFSGNGPTNSCQVLGGNISRSSVKAGSIGIYLERTDCESFSAYGVDIDAFAIGVDIECDDCVLPFVRFENCTEDIHFGSGAQRNFIGTFGINRTFSDSGGNNIIATPLKWHPNGVPTATRDALTNLRNGVVIFNTTTNKLNFYNGSDWEEVTSST